MLGNELITELERRFELDQNSIKEPNFKTYEQVTHENYEWLKEVIEKEGWLCEEKVGKKGECCAWLIVQHSDCDIEFQKRCLKLMNELPLTDERKSGIAYLADRVLINEGKEQFYGTQFREGKVFPIEKVETLDERRKYMGLCPFDEYCRSMQKK